MILIEQDAKRLLMERLDECLKVHADMLDAQNIGSIYELQGLSELHYYLKVEHVFTPAEVEALLSFQDPLDVARWCWEENNHEHSFPICDLLKEIDAEQKFEHFTSEPSAQDKYTLLMKRLGQNYFAYRESLMSRDKESLIEKAAEITAMQEAYSYLTTKFEFGDEMLDDVLALENPLKYFADRWLLPVSDVFDVDMDIRENIAGIRDSQEYLCQRGAGCFCPGTAAKCGSGSAGMSGCGETGTRFRCTVMGRKLYYDGRCIDALCTCTKGFNQS